MLDVKLATTFAHIALTNVATEYPYKLDQVLATDTWQHHCRQPAAAMSARTGWRHSRCSG